MKIDPATGMKPGERYSVERLGDTHPFTGFFLDGKYYLAPELLTAVGWLEGQRFIYDDLDAGGTPVYPDRIVGSINGLTLNLEGGESFPLINIDSDIAFDPVPPRTQPSTQTLIEPVASVENVQSRWRELLNKAPALLVIASMALVGACAYAVIRNKRG